MNLLIVVPRYVLTNKPFYNYLMPLGLGYILAVLKKEGYSVDCLNMNHFRGSSESIVKSCLDSRRYDFVCTGNNAMGYAITKIILETAKSHLSRPRTILGGPIITSEPEVIFNSLKPDFGVLGEGEKTIIELLKMLEKGKDLTKVKGIMYLDKNGTTIKTEAREPIKNLDSIPFPAIEALGFEEQIRHSHTNFSYPVFDSLRVYNVLASRSCPFNCTFCYHDSKYRKRSLNNVLDEISSVVSKHRINVISIYDECFAIDKKRVLEFCRKIKQLQEKISWKLGWMCQMRVENIDREILKIMKDAGCFAISYGFESFSPDVLKSMRKNITPEQIDRAIKLTMEAKIRIQGNFIFGDVAETRETAKTTLEYWKKNCRGQVNLTFVQPYPGSEIYNKCLEKGIIKDKLDFIKNLNSRQFFNMTDKMSDDDIAKLKKDMLGVISRHWNFVKPIKIIRTGKKEYSIAARCPFCNKINIYRGCFIENRLSYKISGLCRSCFMHFDIPSTIQRFAFAYYPKLRKLVETYLNFKKNLMEKKI